MNASPIPVPVSPRSSVTEPISHRRRIVAIELPTLPSDLARRRHRRRATRESGTRPDAHVGTDVVLVFAERHGRRIVKDCCFRARECGVTPGMAMVEATSLVQGDARDTGDGERRGRRRSDDRGAGVASIATEVISVPASPGRDAAALERLAVGSLRFAPIAAVDGHGDVRRNLDRRAGGRAHDRARDEAPPEIRHRILLDIRGCERWLMRMGGESGLLDRIEATFRSAGFAIRTAIADGVVAARAWAGWRPDVDRTRDRTSDRTGEAGRAGRHDHRVLPQGVVWPAIDPLPIECLEFDPEILDRLHQVNVRSVGELRRLPRTALPARYGPALGRRLDQLVGRGGDAFHEPGVKVVRPAVPMTVRRTFTGPVRAREAMELAVIELVERLHARLRAHGAGVRLLRLRVEPPDAAAWIDQIELARSTRRPGHLWSVLEPVIDRVPLDAGVDAVELEAVRHRPLRRRAAAMWSGTGDGVGDSRAADGERRRTSEDGADEESLAAFIDLVQARLGPNAVRRADPIGGHVPEDRMRLATVDRREEVGAASDRRLGERLRAARPPGGPRPTTWLDRPESIRVEDDAGRPRRLRWRGEDHDVAEAIGPERIGTPWWRQRRVDVGDVHGRMEQRTAEMAAGRMHGNASGGPSGHAFEHVAGSTRESPPESTPESPSESRSESTHGPASPEALPHRAYWSVRLSSGIAVWIFRASSDGRWFLQGVWA